MSLLKEGKREGKREGNKTASARDVLVGGD